MLTDPPPPPPSLWAPPSPPVPGHPASAGPVAVAVAPVPPPRPPQAWRWVVLAGWVMVAVAFTALLDVGVLLSSPPGAMATVAVYGTCAAAFLCTLLWPSRLALVSVVGALAIAAAGIVELVQRPAMGLGLLVLAVAALLVATAASMGWRQSRRSVPQPAAAPPPGAWAAANTAG